jgi:hypothetical protein
VSSVDAWARPEHRCRRHPPIELTRLSLTPPQAIFVYGFFTIASVVWLNNPGGQIFLGHFPAMVGLPMGAALAFIVVLLLPASYGPIEFKFVGLTFNRDPTDDRPF